MVAPSDQMSDCGELLPLEATSGAFVAAVPCGGALPLGSSWWARPKSPTTAVPSAERKMLDGFMSRWTIPLSCIRARPRAAHPTWDTTSGTQRRGNSPARSNAPRVASPVTKNGTPWYVSAL